jgi:F0F1-type ATP synthase assembly protein I
MDKELLMSEENHSQPAKFTYTGAGMGIGLVVGGLLGLLIDNLAFSAGGGMVLGLAIGLALENRRQDQ